MALLLVPTVAVGGQLLLANHGQTPVSPGRDPGTGIAPPSVYLTWGGVTDLATFIQSSAVALPDFAHNREAFVYCGVPVIFAAVLGLGLARSRTASVARLLLLFTASFSIAGFLTLSLYAFPLMSNFRHVAYTSVVTRFFECLVGGFGVQVLIDVARRRSLISSNSITGIPLLVALLLLLFLPVPAVWSKQAASSGEIVISPEGRFVLFSVALGLVSGFAIWLADRVLRRRGAEAIAGVLLVSMGVGAWVLTGKIYERDTWPLSPRLVSFAREAIAAPLHYVAVRGKMDPVAEEFLRSLEGQGARYDTTDSLLCRDTPLTGERCDMIPSPTARLLQVQSESEDAFRLLAMPGQPKAFLVDHLEGLAGFLLKPEPGRILLQVEHRTLKAQRIPNVEVEAKDFSFNHVRFDVSGNYAVPITRRFLVYQDAWHPDWTASAAGHASTIWPANVAFKAVELPPEAGEVTFLFGSAKRKVFAWLNAFTAVAALALETGALLLLSGQRRRAWTRCARPSASGSR
jgi:hypothetical protein